MENFSRTDFQIACIGCGNMGQSLMAGLIMHGQPAQHLIGIDLEKEQRTRANREYGIVTTDDLKAAIEQADIVLIAVKPQQLAALLAQIRDIVLCASRKAPLIVPIVAGVPISSYHRVLGENYPLIRAMPNLPVRIASGVTVLYSTSCAEQAGSEKNNAHHQKERATAEGLFSAMGKIIWAPDEQLMDMATAISGSGPAYFFLFMECMEQVAKEWGITTPDARSLVRQTALGAAKLAADAMEKDLPVLRHAVTSPGGTTEQAISEFTRAGFGEIVSAAMNAARKRSIELMEKYGDILEADAAGYRKIATENTNAEKEHGEAPITVSEDDSETFVDGA